MSLLGIKCPDRLCPVYFWFLVVLIVVMDVATIFGPFDRRTIHAMSFWQWLLAWRQRPRPRASLDDWAPYGTWMLPTVLGAACIYAGIRGLTNQVMDLPSWSALPLGVIGIVQLVLTALYFTRPTAASPER